MVGSDFQAAHHEIQEGLPGGKTDIVGQSPGLFEEDLARRQGGADQPVSLIAEGQESVKEEGQDIQGRQQRGEMLLAVAEVRGIGQELIETVLAGVVEGETGGSPELRVDVVQPTAILAVGFQDLGLGGVQDTVEAAEDGQGEDDVLVFTPLEGVPDQVSYTPDEAEDFAVV